MSLFNRLTAGLMVWSLAVVEGAKKKKEIESPYPTIQDVITASVDLITTPAVLYILVVAFLVLAWSVQRSKDSAMLRVDPFLREMLGTVVMVCCTFTPGPFLGSVNGGVGYEEWIAHALGVIVRNPAFQIHQPMFSFHRCLCMT